VALAQFVEVHEEVVQRLSQVVNFVFKLLDVTVRFIGFGLVLVVAAVQVLVVLVLRLLNS